MPRSPRVEFPGAIYHVMNRGNHKEPIFRDDSDREMFLKTLGEACESAGWVIHSFVFMPNHYHLLIETLRPTLVCGMQWLNSIYVRRFNLRHKTCGHLFQGRYKALLVDGESRGYFLTVCNYIHLNPIRARLVQDLSGLLASRWNSAGWLTGLRPDRPAWLRWERFYGELGMHTFTTENFVECRKLLSERIAYAHDNEALKPIRGNWCYGSSGFADAMKAKLMEMSKESRASDTWNSEVIEELEIDRATRLLDQTLHRWGYNQVSSVTPVARRLLARQIRQQTRVSLRWLAKKLGYASPNSLSSAIHTASRQSSIVKEKKQEVKILIKSHKTPKRRKEGKEKKNGKNSQ